MNTARPVDRKDVETTLPSVTSWASAVAAVLDDPDGARMAFQPVVDVQRGVIAGYEALARFQGPFLAPPDAWFRAAAQLGRADELEARAIAAALAVRPRLPGDTFLTVNVSPELLDAPAIRDVFERAGRLDRVVVELTEHVAVADYDALLLAIQRLLDAGASIAVDDAGAGYASLAHILTLRPAFVKLDRAIVDGLDRDGGKLALVEMLGTFASRIDAWVIAEGVERPEELDALVRLGVPLAQGWLLARPGPPWMELPEGMGRDLANRARLREARESVGELVEQVPAVDDGGVDAFDQDPKLDWVVELDDRGWPLGVRGRADLAARPVMRILPSSAVAAVARRAVARPDGQRFDPLVCCDEEGNYRGIVRVERLVERLSS